MSSLALPVRSVKSRAQLSPLRFYSTLHLLKHNTTSYKSTDPQSHYTFLLHNSIQNSHLNQIHAQLYSLGLQNNGFIITKFIHVSSSLKEITYARQLFNEFPEPCVFLWNAIIGAYCKHNMFNSVIEMYTRMLQDSVSADAYTFPLVLKACAGLTAVRTGCAVHAQILRCGFDGDVFVQKGLVSFYVKCGRIECARALFNVLQDRDLVSWTCMISGYVQNGQPMEALRIADEMRWLNVKLDRIALVSILKAYSDIEDLEQGRCVHCSVIKTGLESQPDLQIALVTMYAKCGQVMVARSLFDEVEDRNVMLWNSMISGYVKNGYSNEALVLFKEMISKNLQPDVVTIQSTILASAQLGSLEQARWMDNYVGSNTEFRDDMRVNTGLIHMFAKCGNIELAHQVFNRTLDKDVVVWSAMIMGYALHGMGKEAIELFNEMKHAGVLPNDVTFISLLTACSHSGRVDEGWKFFNKMKEYDIEPQHQHYACVVDMLGRAGYVEKAFIFAINMPIKPDISVWGALLSACKIHRHVSLGEYAAERLFELDPENIGHYVQLSNLYAFSCKWSSVRKIRMMMKEKGLTKDLGYTMIEVHGKLEAFRMKDWSHVRSKEIYEELEWLEKKLIESGFIPDTESDLHDLDEEDKEIALCNHSERLAIAYGLIASPPGTTFQMTKNPQACVNCHLASKLISKIVNRGT